MQGYRGNFMSTKYIVSHAGVETGPFDENEIKQKLLSNQLLPIDYLYDDAKQDWVLLNERFDMKALAPSPTPKMKPVAAKSAAYPNLSQDVQTPPTSPAASQNARKPQVSPPQLGPQVALQTQPPPLTAPPTAAGAAPPVITPAPAKPHIPVNNTSSQTLTGTFAKPTETPPTTSTSNPEATASPSPAATNAPDHSAQQLKFSGGVGTISLKQLQAGKVVIKLESDLPLTLPNDTTLNVEPGPAKTLLWQPPAQTRAGEELNVSITAHDAYGNATPNFNGELELHLKGKKTEKFKVQFQNGRATAKAKWTVAEQLRLELQPLNGGQLTMPQPASINVLAGPAVSLQVETPPNAVAGESMAFTVRAVDQYGNLATDFKGDVNIGMVKAS